MVVFFCFHPGGCSELVESFEKNDTRNMFKSSIGEMIYLYAFTKFAGSDRVFLYPHQDFAFSAGDVVKFGEDYFLVLGEEISFAEAYHFVQAKLNFTCVSAKFLSKKSLELLHRMVAEYYTSYKNVMRYFVPGDIVSLLAK